MRKFNIPQGLHIRLSSERDKPFLQKLHHSTREDLRLIDGDPEFVEEIIEMQYRVQTEGYGDKFPNAMYFIIEKHHEPIGKATLDFGPNEIRLIDLAFLPEAKNHGFGKAILKSFQHCAEQAMTPLSLCVLSSNRAARKTYLSLGFVVESIMPPYEFMSWYPKSP